MKPSWAVQFEGVYTVLFDDGNDLENLYKIELLEFKELGISSGISK
jgi:hypothetical protein